MIRWPPRRRWLDALKAQLGKIQGIDEGIDHANRIALVNPVIEAFRQQRRLRTIRPGNEALHLFPRRIIRRILAAPAFSHSQGQSRSRKAYSRPVLARRLTPESRLQTPVDPPVCEAPVARRWGSCSATRLSRSASGGRIAWVPRDVDNAAGRGRFPAFGLAGPDAVAGAHGAAGGACRLADRQPKLHRGGRPAR